MSENARGTAYGAGAYLLWGLFPLYWPLLEPAGAVEVLAHRIVWSLAVVAFLLAVTRRLGVVRALVRDRRRLTMITAAAIAVALNWGTYIYGVTNDRVVETSLGYFVNPIVTVLLAVVVLGERLRPVQWGALGLAAVAVLGLSVENGGPPLIALVLAFSFGAYGVLKKLVGVGAVEGLAVETAVLAPVAALYLLLLGAGLFGGGPLGGGLAGGGTFTSEGPGHAALLVVAGLVTAVPLLLFGAAASRVSLTALGVLQYLAPTVQFLLGVTLFDEPLPPVKLAGFVLVWIALAIFTVDLVNHARRQARLVVAV